MTIPIIMVDDTDMHGALQNNTIGKHKALKQSTKNIIITDTNIIQLSNAFDFFEKIHKGLR